MSMCGLKTQLGAGPGNGKDRRAMIRKTGAGETVKRPPGWYGKTARAERAGIAEQVRGQRQAEWEAGADDRATRAAIRAEIERRTAPIRAGAKSRLDCLSEVETKPTPTLAEVQKREAERVKRMLKSDRKAAQSELARIDAEHEVLARKFDNLAATAVPPTPELIRTGLTPRTPEKTEGTARNVTAFRRVQPNRIVGLYQRGVLDDDTFPACLWYRRTWEACGFETGAGAASMGERIGGEKTYGFMAKTEIEVSARRDFHAARESLFQGVRMLPFKDMLVTFDLVILDEMTITEAAERAKCRYTNSTLVVKHVAILLLGAVGHLLPTREVGAPGGELPEVERLRKIEALEAGAATAGEQAAAGAAATRIKDRLDPVFFDAHGILRSWEQIAAITRGRVAGVSDAEILASFEEDE